MAVTSSFDNIRVHDAEGVRTVVMDRADKFNALSTAMMADIVRAVAEAPAHDAGLVVLKAAGERVFCAGADLDNVRAGGASLESWEHGFRALMATLDESTLPLLTVTQGRVIGGGIALAALSDVVLACADTSFRFPEFRIGVYPAMVHAVLVPRLPADTVFQLCVGARALSAVDAEQLHVVTEVLAVDGFAAIADRRVAHYAQRIEALTFGRRVRRMPLTGSARERLEAVAPEASRHFRSEPVRRLITTATDRS